MSAWDQIDDPLLCNCILFIIYRTVVMIGELAEMERWLHLRNFFHGSSLVVEYVPLLLGHVSKIESVSHPFECIFYIRHGEQYTIYPLVQRTNYHQQYQARREIQSFMINEARTRNSWT